MVPRETVSFVFPRVLSLGETKLTVSLGPYIKCICFRFVSSKQDLGTTWGFFSRFRRPFTTVFSIREFLSGSIPTTMNFLLYSHQLDRRLLRGFPGHNSYFSFSIRSSYCFLCPLCSLGGFSALLHSSRLLMESLF